MIDGAAAAAVAHLIGGSREDAGLLCVGRPENAGVANVTPTTVTVGDPGKHNSIGISAQVIGGFGACLKLPPGKWSVWLDWPGMPAGDASRQEIVVRQGKVERLNICIVPRTAVRSSWSLLRSSQVCSGV